MPAPDRHVLDFDPSRDGYGFTNHFRWTAADLSELTGQLRPLLVAGGVALPSLVGALVAGTRGAKGGAAAGAALVAARAPQALVRGLARRWPSFGLCGGMAASAVDRWQPGRKAGLVTAKLEPEPMRAALRRRQADTLRSAGSRFVRYWLAARRSARPPLGADLARELETIRARIAAGRPVVVGLAGDVPDPFAMHQVVAFGYETEADGAVRFSVYDPNAPGRTRFIRGRVDGRFAEITTDLPTGPRPKGGFHIHRERGKLAMLFAIEA